MLSRPTAIIGARLLGLTEVNRSSTGPFFRNLVVKPARGPHRSAGCQLVLRVSRWDNDMGGAPTPALPYTLECCCATISGFLHTSNCPLTGKPPYPWLSSIPDFCSRGRAPPPAPRNTKLALNTLSSPLCSSRTVTRQRPLLLLRRLLTEWLRCSWKLSRLVRCRTMLRVREPK